MFVSPAYAQVSSDTMSSFVSMAPLLLIFVVFYFFVIRPQQQRQKQHKTMLGSLRRGDRIVTAGGIVGTVAKVLNDSECTVDIAENVRVRVIRSTISQVLAKTEPAGKEKEAEEGADDADAKKSG